MILACRPSKMWFLAVGHSSAIVSSKDFMRVHAHRRSVIIDHITCRVQVVEQSPVAFKRYSLLYTLSIGYSRLDIPYGNSGISESRIDPRTR